MLKAATALAAALSTHGVAQSEPIIELPSPFVTVEIDGKLDPERWQLFDVNTVYPATLSVAPGSSKRVCFIASNGRHCESVGFGDRYSITVRVGDKAYPLLLQGIAPPANFTAAHVEQFDGRVTYSVPAVYELVNVAIALTDASKKRSSLVYPSVYLEQVRSYFEPVKDHPFVQALEQRMGYHPAYYFLLKMSSYGYDMDKSGRITRSSVYASTNFEDMPNMMAELEPLMRDFAQKGRFPSFYQVMEPWYQTLETKFDQRTDVSEMKRWLEAHFPAVATYNHVNIVFSPLVYGSQSTTRMESNGFREAQLHMNFPYAGNADPELSHSGKKLDWGMLTFTELNHNYINPTADLYADKIAEAFANYPRETGTTTSMYANRMSYFNEMMNWGLVDLYVLDHAEQADVQRLQKSVSHMMAKERGFTQYPAFADFLIPLYRERSKDRTVADLYPQIIAWFAANPPRAME